jgi:DNA-binding HxlR family transcriptional regulator
MDDSKFQCSLDYGMSLIGGKWKLLILWHLSDGTKRFNQLKKLLPNITQRMLTTQLRELESSKLVIRKIYTEVPPKVEYSLSEYGVKLIPVLNELCSWASVISTENHIEFKCKQ